MPDHPELVSTRERGIRQRLLRRLQRTIRSQLPEHRDDRGLTTLEWLLVVAAIAGLAALAVVLVTKVVSDTADQVGNLSPRLAAARLQARDMEIEASQLTLADLPDYDTHHAILRKYKRECERLGILYGDIDGFVVRFIYPPAPAWPRNTDPDHVKQGILRMNAELAWKQGFGGDPPNAGCWMAIAGKPFTTCCMLVNTDLANAMEAECNRLGLSIGPANSAARCWITK